jgi:hypothetical protein
MLLLSAFEDKLAASPRFMTLGDSSAGCGAGVALCETVLFGTASWGDFSALTVSQAGAPCGAADGVTASRFSLLRGILVCSLSFFVMSHAL